MLLTFILIFISIPSPAHSFIPDLKPSFSANPPHHSLPVFFRTDYMVSPFFNFGFSVFTRFSCRFRVVDEADSCRLLSAR